MVQAGSGRFKLAQGQLEIAGSSDGMPAACRDRGSLSFQIFCARSGPSTAGISRFMRRRVVRLNVEANHLNGTTQSPIATSRVRPGAAYCMMKAPLEP